MKYVRKAFLKGTFRGDPSLLGCARLTTSVRAHSLEGTLIIIIIIIAKIIVVVVVTTTTTIIIIMSLLI